MKKSALIGIIIISILLLTGICVYLFSKQFALENETNNCVDSNTTCSEKGIAPEITIEGNNNCVSKTNEALTLIKNKAKDNYDILTKYIGVIECSENQSGMFAWEIPPRYQAGKMTVNAGTIWYAGTIVHDACHSKQYNDYLAKNNSTEVPNEIYSGKDAETECINVQYSALKKIGATEETLQYVKDSINSEYWEINYSERYW